MEAAIDELLGAAPLRGRRRDRRRASTSSARPAARSCSRGCPLDDDRRTVGGLVVIDDVTERRRLEAVRRDFVANISHELKTPVGALGLLAETLLDEDDPAVAQRLAERMLHEAFRVGRTIDDLLELSPIEAEEARPRERGAGRTSSSPRPSSASARPPSSRASPIEVDRAATRARRRSATAASSSRPSTTCSRTP